MQWVIGVGLFLIINTPEFIGFGIDPYHVFAIFAVFFLLVKISSGFYIHSVTFWGFGAIFFYTCLLYLINSDGLVSWANSIIPNEWYRLYNKQHFSNFYRDKSISLRQLIGFCLLLVYFEFGVRLKHGAATVSTVIKLSLPFQVMICFVQITALGEPRAYGTLGGAQSLGFFAALSAVWLMDRERDYYFWVFLCCVLLVMSGSRGPAFSFACTILAAFLVPDCWRRKSVLVVLIISLASTLALSLKSEYMNMLLSAVSIVTSSHSLKIRALMWQSFFEVISASPVLGVYGRTVYFTDNLYWFFLISYGVSGLLFPLAFWGYLSWFVRHRFIYMVVLLMILQSFSYYGFFVSNLGVVLFFMIGSYLGEKKSLCCSS